MARIADYSKDTTITGGDKVIGTNQANGDTVNFLVEDLANYISSIADVDVSVANLKIRLPQIDSDITIGDGSDVDTTISGDLNVNGDLTVNGAISGLSVEESLSVVFNVKNTSGGLLPKGTVVHVASTQSSQGNIIDVVKADNSSAAGIPAIGILNVQLADDGEGEAVVVGRVSGIDTSAFTAGDELYVNTNGGFTNVKPTGTTLIQKIAVVIKSHASNGSIEVFGAGRSNDLPNIALNNVWLGNASGVPTPTIHTIENITDVNITNLQDNQILKYNSSTSKWQNEADGGGGGGVQLTDLSVGTEGTASGDGDVSYNNSTGVFTYTPPDLSSYLTSAVDGTGTANNLPIWSDADTLTDSILTQDSGATKVQVAGGIDTTGIIQTSTTNANLQIQGNGTGGVEVRGAGGNDGKIQINCSANSHGVTLQSPPHSSGATYTLILPTTSGTSGQVLTSGGSSPSQLTWSTPSTGAIDGTGSANKLAIWSDADTLTNDTDLHWDDTNNRLGIGTATPSATLDVDGASIFRDQLNVDPDGNPNNVLSLNARVANDYSNLVFRNGVGTANWAELVATPNTLAIETNSVERLRIDSAGNVGIGTDSPSGTLDIKNSTVSSYNLRLTAADNGDMGGFYQTSSNAAELYLKNGSSSTKLKLASDGSTWFNGGNVGIGTAAPAVSLDINAADAIAFPTGTTAQRPSSPAAGMLRYNSTEGQFEGYTTEWGSIGGGEDYTPLAVTKNGSNQFVFNFADAVNFSCAATGTWTFNPTVVAADVGKSGVIIINNTGTTTPGALPSVFKTPNGDAIVFETDSGDTSIISYFIASTTKVLVNYVGNFS